MISISLFLLAIVTANLSAAYFGPAATPINAFFLIGLDITLRDRLHEMWHGKQLKLKMLGLISAGGALTYVLNQGAGQICIASVVSFMAALTVDVVIYEGLYKCRRTVKINGSNIGAAAVDSILFPTIAFGAFIPWILFWQFAAKVSGGFIWSIVFVKISYFRKLYSNVST